MLSSGSLLAVDEIEVTRIDEDIRRRALERLYSRRNAVDALIRSLEVYQETELRRAPCIPINAVRTWS